MLMHLIARLQNVLNKNEYKYNEKFQHPFSKTDITKQPDRKAVEDVKNTINNN